MADFHTLIVAPTESHNHRTCPEPITRSGSEVPSENVNRLKVLTDPGMPSLPDHLFSCVHCVQNLCCNAWRNLLHRPYLKAVFANHHLYSNPVTFAYSLANDTVLAQLLLLLEFVA